MSSSSTSSTTEHPERIAVGRILRPRGLRGELVVESLSDLPDRYAPGARLAAVSGTGRSEQRRELVVRSAVESKPGLLVVEFETVGSRETAEALRGARLEVERSQVPPAPAGEYWQFELVGCRAFDRRRGEIVELGVVEEVADAGAGPLLVVKLVDGRKVPLPFVEKFLVAVDPAARRIEWSLPEGLIEACASKS